MCVCVCAELEVLQVSGAGALTEQLMGTFNSRCLSFKYCQFVGPGGGGGSWFLVGSGLKSVPF